MKKSSLLLFCFLLSSAVFAGGGGANISSTEFIQVQMLAEMGLIVDQKDPTLYRLDDAMLRQELLGTALKVSGVTLPSEYACRGYFSDAKFGKNTTDAWVCRAFEL